MRRSGDAESKRQVQELMRLGKAAWCDAIRLELWRGVGSDADRHMLRRLEADITSLAIDSETWNLACHLGDAGRKQGMQFPSPDLLIFACAKQHSVELITRDKHFDQLSHLWKRI
jgi:predicted nucleic acid-binding protein